MQLISTKFCKFGFHTISKYHKANIVCVHEGEIRQDLRSPDKNIEELAIELSKISSKTSSLHGDLKEL